MDARACWTALRVIGAKVCVVIFLCAWISAIVEFVGMVVALGTILAYLLWLVETRSVDRELVSPSLQPALVTIGMILSCHSPTVFRTKC